MAKQRTQGKARPGSTRRVGSRPVPHELVASRVPTIPEMMVMSGNKPHETLLHDFLLEDFGLDVLGVILPNRL